MCYTFIPYMKKCQMNKKYECGNRYFSFSICKILNVDFHQVTAKRIIDLRKYLGLLLNLSQSIDHILHFCNVFSSTFSRSFTWIDVKADTATFKKTSPLAKHFSQKQIYVTHFHSL